MRRYTRNWRERAGFIGRVLGFGKQHVCGICRTRYLSRMDAETCLDNCWEELLGLDPVICQPAYGHMIYKCRYCARQHSLHLEAGICARACRLHFLHKHDLERQILSELAEMPAPPKLKLQRKALEQNRPQAASSDKSTPNHASSTRVRPQLIDPFEADLTDGGRHANSLENDEDSEALTNSEFGEQTATAEERPVAKNLGEWADFKTDENKELEEIVDAI